MEFIRNINLNTICRWLDIVAVAVLVLGIIGSIILGIHTIEHRYRDETIIEWPIIIGGISASLLNSLFLLFLSRIGDAVDDIRNKYVN